MAEYPEFSESQLQQLINTEVTMRIFIHGKIMCNPIVINLIEEHDLGWDTAFYFPWLFMPSNPNHRGCNFFIQYKLSTLWGSRAGEYSDWGRPYLRFQIPYSKKDQTTKQYFYDYNQYNHLKNLANQGYYVFYATNHVTRANELLQIANSQHLLHEIPFLDISTIHGYHKKVTFTQDSSYFLLHTEPKKINIVRWKQIYSAVKEDEGTVFLEDVKFLKKFILKIEKDMKLSEKSFYHGISKISDMQSEKRVIAETIMILKYLKIYLNICWFRSWY